jgi:hypothetical protein
MKNVIVKKTTCPNEHSITLHIIADTPNLIQMVACPICGAERMALIGQLVDVTSDENSN